MKNRSPSRHVTSGPAAGCETGDPGQLQHIVSFKDKNFTSTDFNRLSDEYFTEHFTYQTALSAANPGDIQYKGIDLSKYLSADPSAKRGIFLLSLRAWDPAKPAEARKRKAMTKGMRITKRMRFSTRALWWSLIWGSSRNPPRRLAGCVRAVRVYRRAGQWCESLCSGQNGTTLLSRTTGSDGHAAFPPLHDFRNEQMAVMFPAEKRGCLLPAGQRTV